MHLINTVISGANASQKLSKTCHILTRVVAVGFRISCGAVPSSISACKLRGTATGHASCSQHCSACSDKASADRGVLLSSTCYQISHRSFFVLVENVATVVSSAVVLFFLPPVNDEDIATLPNNVKSSATSLHAYFRLVSLTSTSGRGIKHGNPTRHDSLALNCEGFLWNPSCALYDTTFLP